MNATINTVPRSFGIRSHLLLGFMLLVVPILFVIGVLLFKINSVENFTDMLVKVELPTQAASTELDTELYESQLAVYNWLLTKNPQFKIEYEKTWQNINNSQSA